MKHASVLILALICLALCAPPSAWAQEPGGNLRFKPGDGGEFEFNTGVLSGKLRAEGKSVGLLPVVHVPTGATITRSMGLVGHYRVFTMSHRYGKGAWFWPSDAKLLEDGAVEVHWPAAEDRPFDMWAVYRWAAPAILDVETRVRSKSELPDFETFLACYFAAFTNSLVYVQADPGKAGKPGLMAADESHGIWQAFPLDRDAVRLIQDGRWKIEPNPVDWVIMPILAKPIGVRRDSKTGTTAVWMSPPEDCFAISTPHQTEGHFSLYLSLFGRTIKAGELARARARLVITTSPSDAEILEMYRAYTEHLEKAR